jgi:hypothetical protein
VINSLFDSVLKNLCRLSRLTPGASKLLLYVVRNHDFDECFTFRDELYSGTFDSNSWQFRRQLLTFLLRDTEPNVDFSDLLISLLFIYPNAAQLEQLHSFSLDGMICGFKVYTFFV